MSSPIVSQERENTNPFNSRFVINAELGHIFVEAEHEYLARCNVRNAVALSDNALIRIDGSDGPLLVTAAEALQVAAAIQAVAIDLLEQQPREIRRNTEPGNPSFEEGI